MRDKFFNELDRFNVVAESGFNNKNQLDLYKRNGIDLFLIGEGLLKKSL